MYDIFQIGLPILLEVYEKEERGFLKAAPGPAHHSAQSREERKRGVLSGLMLRYSCVRQTKESLGIIM
jgi:hypothetical protein